MNQNYRQPNVQVLRECLKGIAEDLPRILRQLQDANNNTQKLLVEMEERMNERMDKLEAKIELNNRVAHARTLNSIVECASDPLYPLPYPSGTLPAANEFPATLGDFKDLTGDALSELIVRYKIKDANDIPDDVEARRGLVAEHFAIVPWYTSPEPQVLD
ncbi:hypothetical protein RSOLAG22IIIB_05528 [Rhizoctonia solani]|uniref:Uncharacterized protein n=1 Tax=Rhizoctonia solani TaxID=456999 RepID=A0A0K6G7L6_9AGAM|nr:hypothetical protein RSOLAG22IIIB_05528 [Rhizoctonia solani]